MSEATELDDVPMTWDEGERQLRELRTDISDVSRKQLIQKVKWKRSANLHGIESIIFWFTPVIIVLGFWLKYPVLWLFVLLGVALLCLVVLNSKQQSALDKMYRYKHIVRRLDVVVHRIGEILDTRREDREPDPGKVINSIVKSYVEAL